MRNFNKKLGLAILVGAILCVGATLQAKKPSLNGALTAGKIGKLFDEINANNPQKNSDFLILTATGWKSAGLKGWIMDAKNPLNRETSVTLAQDPAQIQALITAGHLDAPTAAQYINYLLYFMFNGNKVYINNPYPGKIVFNRDKKTMAKKPYTRNPARDIMTKWQP